jgi:iron complex transport system permease protein
MTEATAGTTRGSDSRRATRLALAAMIAAASLVVGLAAGERWLDPFDPGSPLDARIVWSLRWPRVQGAALVGALLALGGALLQTLVGNPLAEPYVLGVAGSGAVGAIAALAWSTPSPWSVPVGAFLGAGVGTATILPFVRLGPARLLLAGVVLAALWGALVSLALALAGERDLGRAVHWMLGDLGSEHVSRSLLWAGVFAMLAAGAVLAPHLDRLALGDTHAATMGTPVLRLRFFVVLLASCSTGLAVAAAGTLGFVGLVVPHAARLLVGSPHRVLLPACAAGGAALLVLADAAARTVIAPAELPAGVVTAALGVPVFLWLLVRQARWTSS